MLDPIQRKEYIHALQSRMDAWKKILAANQMTSAYMEQLREDKERLERYSRMERGLTDPLYFLYTYFSEDFNPGNAGNLIPAGVTLDDAPNLHREFSQMLHEVSNVKIDSRICVAAPRGHVKSGIFSNMFPVHQICYQLRKYILILSETDAVSKKFIEWIANELKFNVKLRTDFGDLLNPQRMQNERDNQEAFLTRTGILVESSSIGKQLRGKRNGSHRPDLVIGDDLESAKNTNTPELRERNLHWFNSVVMPIGNPKRTAFIYVGTLVHADGVLATLLHRGDFQSRVYSAICSPPVRADLWQTFEEKYRDLEDSKRLQHALAFYHENQAQMDEGVVVLWPQRWTYPELMLEKVNLGSRAFASELLNQPMDLESQLFKVDHFHYYSSEEINLRELEIFSFWDIAMGKNNRSDYNAIVTLGRSYKTNLLYVVDAWAQKCPAHKALDMCIEKMKEYRPRVFGVEVVQAQYDFYRQLQAKLLAQKIFYTKLKPVTPKGNKETRIEILEPLTESGQLRFLRGHRLLLEMLAYFPKHAHDDLPDALAAAVNLCGITQRRTFSRKPKGV